MRRARSAAGERLPIASGRRGQGRGRGRAAAPAALPFTGPPGL